MSITAMPGMAAKIGDRSIMLASMLAISETMLTAAQDGHWENLAEHETRRQQVAWEFFAEPLSQLELKRYAADLDRVLQLSRALAELVSTQRDSIGAGLAQLNRGRDGAGVYAQQMRDARGVE